jgi:adenine-specific DNA-methyltransferase
MLPDGREVWPEKQWQWSRERALAALANNDLVISEKRGKIIVSYKQYLRDEEGEERRRKPMTIIDGFYTQHGTYEGMDLFGLEDKFAFPKPEGLINYILEAATKPGDIILDSFLGSGTTAAVAHKMGRRWIGVEMGEHAFTHCLPRLTKVIEGEQGGISEAIGWKGGGGFRFVQLGETVFQPDGSLNPKVSFNALAAHIWWRETGTPMSTATTTPLLGTHDGKAYYLLYNGILGDKRPEAGNVLTPSLLSQLPKSDGQKVIFAEACMIPARNLERLGIIFKQVPYDLGGLHA